MPSGSRRTRLPGTLGRLERVHSPTAWRALHRLLRTRSTNKAVAWFLRRQGHEKAEDILSWLETRLVWTGWPIHSAGWVNLDVARFTWRIRRRIQKQQVLVPPRASRYSGDRPVRLGCLASFSGLLALGPTHFAKRIPELELHVFDLEYRGALAPYLEPLVASYHPFTASDLENGVSRLAAAINEGDLDALLVFGADPTATAVLDHIDTPCIAFACTGSVLLPHERVSFSIWVQPEADYFVHKGRLFSGLARAPYGPETIYDGFFVYDLRGLLSRNRLPVAQREPLIVSHGSLYKAASDPFLDVVTELLIDDARLEWVLFGKDDGAALDHVRLRAQQAGVAGRVHWEGEYSPVRGSDGDLHDPGWDRLVAALSRARLAPNPWPIGGGSARVEAYAMDVPTVHMAVRFDRKAWGRPQHAVVDLPNLEVPAATATEPNRYREICRAALYNDEFASQIVAAQRTIAATAGDGERYWRDVHALYLRWLGERRTVVRVGRRS